MSITNSVGVGLVPTLCSFPDHRPLMERNKNPRNLPNPRQSAIQTKSTLSALTEFPTLVTFSLSALLARFPNLAFLGTKNKFAFPNKICYHT